MVSFDVGAKDQGDVHFFNQTVHHCADGYKDGNFGVTR